MTWALCIICGAIKDGAICSCPICKVATSGDVSLDIAFSDHRFARCTLQDFGRVIRAIAAVTPDRDQRFYTFLYYVTTHHPEILKAQFEPAASEQVSAILAIANPPAVRIVDAPFLHQTDPFSDPAPQPEDVPRWLRDGLFTDPDNGWLDSNERN